MELSGRAVGFEIRVGDNQFVKPDWISLKGEKRRPRKMRRDANRTRWIMRTMKLHDCRESIINLIIAIYPAG